MHIELIQRKLDKRIPAILDQDRFHRFAVLLPLLQIEGELHLLFEVRALHLRRQPGEICFPGGRMDPDDLNEQYTAVRETAEELGVLPESISYVYPLDYMVSPFGTIIYPYIGVLTDFEQIRPNPEEVSEIFTIPLSYLVQIEPECFHVHCKLEPEPSFPLHLIAGGAQYNWQVRSIDEYFYYYEDRVIWGLTARILKHFLDLLQE